jgi:ribose transport system ATP-binding protein
VTPVAAHSMASEPTQAGVLEVRRVSKEFPGVRALQDVSLRLRAGRLLALLGENGAGKSTLMNILAGVFAPDSGQVLIDGDPVELANPRDANMRGIAAIFQELSLIPNLTVAENVYLAREPRTRLGLVDRGKMNRDTQALLARMELSVAPDVPVSTLRVGQRQVIEIARALSINARFLIMDEPTSALSQLETQALFRLIADLKHAGVGIIYITHKFEELAKIGDDVAVLRDGKLVAESLLGALTHDAIVRLMVGRKPSATQSCRRRRVPGRELLRVGNASLPHPSRPGDFLVRDVRIHVAYGEVVGIFGLMGAGRTELLETLFGLHSARADIELMVDGNAVRFGSPTQAIAAGLALAPEDRKRDGLVLDMGSRSNASLVCLRNAQRWGLLSRDREGALVEPLLRRFNFRGPSLEDPVRTLSGGNQQKVILAKWLSNRPQVLLLDEPTRGIDVNAKNEIYGLIDELADNGLAVIMVSSELPEILTLSDRIIVMREGRKTAELLREDATPEVLMRAALPGSATEVGPC